MKYYSGEAVIKFCWDQVAAGYWKRYPNPHSTHVLSEDTLVRRISGNKLYSTRLLTKTNKLPRWGERFISGSRFVCIIEESVIDPQKQTLTTYTRNIGLTKIMDVHEKCTYRPSTENSQWTVVDREAWVSSHLFGFSYALQAFGIERFKSNAGKAIKGFEHVLNKLYTPDSLPEPSTSKLGARTDKLKSTAKKATELAKSKAVPVVAKCSGGATAS